MIDNIIPILLNGPIHATITNICSKHITVFFVALSTVKNLIETDW